MRREKQKTSKMPKLNFLLDFENDARSIENNIDTDLQDDIINFLSTTLLKFDNTNVNYFFSQLKKKY